MPAATERKGDPAQIVANVPVIVREARQWIPWRATDGKKVPVNSLGRASNATDPQHWMTLPDALGLVAEHRADGVGIALTHEARDAGDNFAPVLGVDIDWKNCPDAEVGTIPTRFQGIIAALDSYTEYSPSGKGAHVLVAAHVDMDQGTRKHTWPDGSEISLMQDRCYITYTGQKLARSRPNIEHRQEEIDRLVKELWPLPEPARQEGPTRSTTVVSKNRPSDRFVIDWDAQVSDEDIHLFIEGYKSTAEQKARRQATWEMRRTRRTPNAEYVLGDDSVSTYLLLIVKQVMFIAPPVGWSNPEQKAADFCVTFAKRHDIPKDKITAGRIRADIANWHRTNGAQIIHFTREEEQSSTNPPQPGASALIGVLPNEVAVPPKLSTNEAVGRASAPVSGNSSANCLTVTKRRSRKAPGQDAVLAAVASRKNWVSKNTLARQLDCPSSKALLMRLNRLVKSNRLEHKPGRSGMYRAKRAAKPSGPRKRQIKPFRITENGTECKWLTRSELRARGWSLALIDAVFPQKGRDYKVQSIPIAASKNGVIEARYYSVARIKDAEAQPGFEQKRFELRKVRQARGSRMPDADQKLQQLPVQRRPMRTATRSTADAHLEEDSFHFWLTKEEQAN